MYLGYIFLGGKGIMQLIQLSRALALLLLPGFVGCLPAGQELAGADLASPSPHPEFVWKCQVRRPVVQRPGEVCGRPGFEYLLKVYFAGTCRGCHFQGSPVHPLAMADGNLEVAYQSSLTIQRDLFIDRVTKNRLLVPECNLAKNDPVLADFMHWNDHRQTCD